MSDTPSYIELAQRSKGLIANKKFTRYGKSVQLTVDSADDLPEVLELDEALWAATAAPTSSFECDAAFLRYLDSKGAGRVRVAEVKLAIRWLLEHVEASEIRDDNTELNLDALLDSGAKTAAVRTVAGKLLRRFKAESLSLKQVQQVLAEVQEKGPKLAGAVAPEDITTGDDNVADDGGLTLVDLVDDILQATDADDDVPKAAITQSDLEQFFVEAEKVQKWREAGESIIRPLGDSSAAAVSLYNELKPKIDEYFQLCAATALDPTLTARWQLPAPGSENFQQQLAAAPLARPVADQPLPLSAGTNPVYAEKLKRFADNAVVPLFGESGSLTASRWGELEKRLASYREWYSVRPGVGALKIPKQRLNQWLNHHEYRQRLETRLVESRKALVEIGNLEAAEKLLLFQSQLLRFVNSFVSFPDLYNANGRALFEMGTLIMDGRRFTLAVRLTERARHVKFSADSNMYVLYVEITGDDEKTLYEVAVPVTSGTRGNLQLGKRGIFHDRHGKEFHARVVQLVEKPISLREAIAAPFKALGGAITGKIEGLADQAKDKLLTTGTTAVDGVTQAPAAPAPAEPAPNSAGGSGFLAGGGIAVAALASSAAFITKTLANLSLLKVLTGVLTAAALVIVPVTLLAWIRLRRRDLSSILEGSGWAINARMRLDRSQANTFTVTPSAGLLPSAYAGRNKWLMALAIAVLLTAIGGYIVVSVYGWPAIKSWLPI